MSSIMKGIVDETPAKKGADGKRCWKGKRYAGTVNGKDKCIPVDEAGSAAQQAAIAVNMKKKGQKPKHVDEAKAADYLNSVRQYLEGKYVQETGGVIAGGIAAEGKKVDRMVKHIEKSEEKAGKSKKEAENIAWATANKRGMLDNKNKKGK